MSVELILGDCLEVMRGMPDGSYTACLCDPPYGLRFMGKAWDHGVPGVPYWAEVLRVLAPGAVLMAFGGTRTFHRLACAIEDAGFEICDQILWVYGSGFPKSHNISKAIDKAAGAERDACVWTDRYHDGGTRQDLGYSNHNGAVKITPGHNGNLATLPATPDAVTWNGWGTALKPAVENIVVARKPRGGLTYAECAVRYGSGALWIDGGRVGTEQTITRRNGDSGGNGAYGRDERVFERQNPPGRWPANLIHDGSDEATAGMPESKDGVAVRHNGVVGGRIGPPGNKAIGTPDIGYGGSGSAARYFYCAKASRSERDAGLEGWGKRDGGECYGDGLGNGPDRIVRANHHPTVKPLALTEYLAKLLRPPEAYLDDAALLVPFAGVGSEMIGAVKAGWRNVTGIELSAEYVELGRARLAHWQEQVSPQLELALP